MADGNAVPHGSRSGDTCDRDCGRHPGRRRSSTLLDTLLLGVSGRHIALFRLPLRSCARRAPLARTRDPTRRCRAAHGLDSSRFRWLAFRKVIHAFARLLALRSGSGATHRSSTVGGRLRARFFAGFGAEGFRRRSRGHRLPHPPPGFVSLRRHGCRGTQFRGDQAPHVRRQRVRLQPAPTGI
jgi:hypothetical protein